MASAAGIWTHAHAAQPALGAHSAVHPAPLTGPATGNTGPSSPSDPSTISANDFLTLLVTEMQNQDPTDDTDPNAYIDQLVQVNSLEQLIDINQNLSTALGDGSPAPSANSSTSQVSPAAAGVAASTPTGAPSVIHPVAHKGSALGQIQSTAANSAAANSIATHTPAHSKLAPGNLSVPESKPAARRVAQSLGGGVHSQ